MDDVTIFFLVGCVAIIMIQYFVKYPPVYFLGELMGVGGLYQVISEVDNATMGDQVGLIFSILAIMTIIYSSMNLVNLWMKYRK